MTATRSGWRSSDLLFLVVALLVPPIAILLLFLRPEPRRTKILAAVFLVLLTGLYVNTGSKLLRESAASAGASAADWRKLEAHRATQARQPAKAQRAAAGRYWTGFRGPGTAGVYEETAVIDPWPSSGPPLLWKQPIGEGWSSFAIADGVAFTIEKRRDREVVAAYDLEDGRELWTSSWRSRFAEAADRDGPRATPAWDDGRVYAVGAAGDLVALDARTGEELWRRDILAENGAGNITWGVSASPLIAGDLVVTMPGGPDGRAVVAYDKKTGEPRWQALSDAASYTTPLAATLAGVPQIVVVTSTRVVGLDPADGTQLWEHPWATDMGINVAQPILVGDDRFILSAGYGHGAALVEVARDGDAGEASPAPPNTPRRAPRLGEASPAPPNTPRRAPRLVARKVWENTHMKNKFSSSVYHDGHVYGLDEGILACIEVATGEQCWKAGRYGHGQLLLARGVLIVLTEEGELAVVEAKPDAFVERSRFAAIDGRTWNHPALASGILLIRNGREMAAYRIAAS